MSQSNNVLNKGGHIVWLGRDIRNQSPLCSVLPADYAQQLQQDRALGLSAVPHAHTLRLFREALRCAAGLAPPSTSAPVTGPSTASTAASATSISVNEVLAVSKSAEESPTHAHRVDREMSRLDSQDSITTANSPLTPGGLSMLSAVRTESDTMQSNPDQAASSSVLPGINTTITPPPTQGAATSPTGTATTTAAQSASTDASASAAAVPRRPHGIVVSFDMGCMHGATRGCGYVTGSSSSTTGLSVDEILDMAMLAGADPNVSLPPTAHAYGALRCLICTLIGILSVVTNPWSFPSSPPIHRCCPWTSRSSAPTPRTRAVTCSWRSCSTSSR